MILLSFLIVLGVMILASCMVLSQNWSNYYQVYKSLPDRKFYKNRTQVYSHEFGKYDDGFVWFINGGFRLGHSSYLHDFFITWLDPYSMYWLVKYKKWFKENIDLKTIEDY